MEKPDLSKKLEYKYSQYLLTDILFKLPVPEYTGPKVPYVAPPKVSMNEVLEQFKQTYTGDNLTVAFAIHFAQTAYNGVSPGWDGEIDETFEQWFDYLYVL